jgi:hypothetical protein
MAKNAIEVVLDKVNKADYATFESMADMREAVNAHVKTVEESDLRPNMKKKLVRLLDFLRDNSRTYLGLSFKKQRVIADFFGVKKADTIGVWFKKLAELGCVKVIATKRSSTMHQTANFVQIMPVEKAVEQEVVQENRAQADEKNGLPEDNITLNTKSINNKQRYNHEPKEINTEELDATYTHEFVPSDFVQTVKPYINNAIKIETYWNKFAMAVKQVNKHTGDDLSERNLTDLAVSAFKQVVRKKRKIRDMVGYFYGVCYYKAHDYRIATEEMKRQERIEAMRENAEILFGN